MFVNFNILNQLGSPAINSNTFANRPAAGQTGRLFVSTDTFEIYRDNGTTWDLIGGPGSSTITGTGTATQVAYFTSSQAIGSSANLFWDNTNTRLGVGTASPGYTIEANGAVKADRIYLTGATAANGALYWTSDRVTLANYNVGGIVRIETNGGLDAATFGADLTATFVSGIGTRGYTGSTSYGALFNGSVGINTATPGAALDIHSTGTIAQFNTTAATGNVFLAIQRSGTGLWRIGDTYNGGSNFFEIHNTALANNAIQIAAATNKSILTSLETYSTGVARGNLLDYTLSLANGTTFTSPNTVTALGATLNLNIAGSATIPAGARSGADFFNGINFTSAGTFTVNQASTIRAFSNVTAGWAFNGSAVGTVTHLAGLRILFPTNSGSAINVTDNYALLINNQNANTGTITYTNRWGIYQEGASDLNYMAANLLLGSTVNTGDKLQITGYGKFWDSTQGLTIGAFTGGSGFGAIYAATVTPSSINHSFAASSSATILNVGTGGVIDLEVNTVSALYINSSRNVGIGTTNPSYKLNVVGGNEVGSRFIVTGTYAPIQFSGDNSTTLGGINAYAGIIAIGRGTSTGVNPDIAINSSGNVGIGTTSPSAPLTVAGQTDLAWVDAVTTLRINRSGSVARFQNYDGGSAANISFAWDGGNVGIGTTSPAYKLEVDASNPTNGIVGQFYNTATSSQNGSFVLYTQFGIADWFIGQPAATNALTFGNGKNLNTVGSEFMRITSGGNVLIGTTTNAGQKVYINGSLRIDGQTSGTAGGSSGQHLIINCDGTTYKIALLNN